MRYGRFSLTLLLTAAAGPVLAQGVAVQWNFNNSDTTASVNNTGGTPTATTLGGVTATFAAAGGNNGSSDPAATNMGWQTTDYQAQGAGNLTSGVRFNASTAGFSDLIARLDLRHSNTSSNVFRIEYTTDGTNWTNGGTFAALGFERFYTHTLDLTGVTAANNNANFGLRVLTEYASGGSTYAAANPTSTYAATGTYRFDMVTVARTNRWVGGTSSDAGVASNWQGGVIPTTSDATVIFGASAGTAVNLPVAITRDQLVFAANAASHSFTSTGGAALTLAGGITHKGSSTQTFGLPVTFGLGSPTFENAGTLVFNQPVTFAAGATPKAAGPGTFVMNSPISGGDDFYVDGGQRLAGTNTVTGMEVHVFNGLVRGGHPGTANNLGTLTVNVSGDLELYVAPSARAPTLQVELNRTGANAAQNSLVRIQGGTGSDLELNDATADGANGVFKIQLIAPNLALNETYTQTILTTDSTGSIEFDGAQQANGAILPAGSYELFSPNITAFSNVELRVVDVGGGSTLVLQFTPVPEPGTVLGVSAAAAGFVVLLRRRNRVHGRVCMC